MSGGQILHRGSESFAETTREAVDALAQARRDAAANEIHETLRDISRRPEPDVTGAIQHAIAALESTARDVTGELNLTLGRLVPQLSLAPPLDTAVEKLWGYASDRARHIREGRTVTTYQSVGLEQGSRIWVHWSRPMHDWNRQGSRAKFCNPNGLPGKILMRTLVWFRFGIRP